MTLIWRQTNERCHYAEDGYGGTFWIFRELAETFTLEYDHFELEMPDKLGSFSTLELAKQNAVARANA